MSPTHRLAIPHEGGRLSKRYSIAPTSWGEALRRDLGTIVDWLASLGEPDTQKARKSILYVSGVGEGFRIGSKVMKMVAVARCECPTMPHRENCMIWKSIEVREHMFMTWGITPSTTTPPEKYLDGIIRFPARGAKRGAKAS